jgi:hypothetical protein
MKNFFKKNSYSFKYFSIINIIFNIPLRSIFLRYICPAVIITFIAFSDSNAVVRRMIGPNITMSWASSYLAIESGSVTVQNDSSWTYATATGWFFDALLTPYISMRTNWFFYPTPINSKLEDMNKDLGEIPLHEMGFSVLRHFNFGSLNPWFGAGPFLQFATIDDVNSYILHALLSVGFDYEISEDTFLCPQLMSGLGMKLISSKQQSVVIDVPTGKDFSTSGIVIFFKIGVGKAF